MSDAAEKQTPVLQTSKLTKWFGPVRALYDVDFNLYAGEVHAVLGENGAGKSTLVKLITGVYRKDSGAILLEGQAIEPHSPHEAQAYGISTVYQEINLIPTLSVAENLFLGRQPMRMGFIKTGEINSRAKALLKTYNLDIDASHTLSAFSVAVQQIVAIARGVDMSAKVLILDEPTSSLDAHEVQLLFEIMRSLKARGISILLITHFLNQVYEISDRITVLRNGEKIGEYLAASLPKRELVSLMLGRELVSVTDEGNTNGKAAHQNERSFLQVEGIARRGMLEPLDLSVAKGEIVGLAGLLGSGRTETAKLIFGVEQKDIGTIYVKGQKTTIRSPRQAIGQGFGMCPEDRKIDGIIPELSVRENIILALQAKRGWFKTLSRKRQEEIAVEMIEAMRIVTPDSTKPVGQLSGGNQQKVILARWLASQPELLILDEPTRGIDVGAHAEIIQLIKRLCADGLALLVISSELAEIVEYSHRVVVLRDRKKLTELTGDDISEQMIMHTIAES
ncbi:MAG: sugar ABC transporter ATP-binding protein [Anaerolineae bacterium]|nr:sugar ABC transporter ATP-binding protein [Anaerolineae bacterium]